MAASVIDPSTLIAFQNAAAGHEGTLSDPSGTLFVKPCTQAEISFYETANASYSELAEFMPTYMGTLQHSTPATSDATSPSTGPPARQPAESSTAATLKPTDVGPMHGKALTTDVLIVLANTTAGFTRANVLDLKLGARLWDDAAPVEKRRRLDAVAEKTTSSSLGFRIAGMRTWQGGSPPKDKKEYTEVEEDTNMMVYNKLYGRQFTNHNVVDGFKEFLLVPQAGIDLDHALGITTAFLDGIKRLRDVLEKTELRMYSASILLVYEGHGPTFDEKHTKMQEQGSEEDNMNADGVAEEKDEDDYDDDDEEDKSKLLCVKLIDFAHARFVPGEGRDENMLRGVCSIVKLLEQLEDQFKSKA